ncbi:MAG: hypothetical protein BAJALOKI1v1_1340006 [Promethearchaeota archaeon]|nr:MAG: hypothetical protein BAJALOKI1v1_1340006 [Candidatus Lokiarchaeota archaeon]
MSKSPHKDGAVEAPKDQYFQNGIRLFKTKKYELAVEEFKNSIELNAAYFQPYLMIALIKKTQEKFEEGLQWIEKALDQKPEESYCLYVKAFILGQMGKMNEARRILDLSLAINSENIEALVLNATMLMAAHEFEDALLSINKALEIDPTNQSAQVSKLVVLESLGWTDKLQEYKHEVDRLLFRELFLDVSDAVMRIVFAADKGPERIKPKLSILEKLTINLKEAIAYFIYGNTQNMAEIYPHYIKLMYKLQNDPHFNGLPIKNIINRKCFPIYNRLKKNNAIASIENALDRANDFPTYSAETAQLKTLMYTLGAMIRSVNLTKNRLYDLFIQVIDALGHGLYTGNQRGTGHSLTSSEINSIEHNYTDLKKNPGNRITINLEDVNTFMMVVEHAIKLLRLFIARA